MYSTLRFLPRVFFKGKFPLHLTFFVTNRCSSNCLYCFYREELNQAKDILKVDEVEKVAQSLRANLLWLLLSGGEPFLYPQLDKICQAFYNHNRPSLIMIPTGCTLPEVIEKKLREIVSGCPNSCVVLKASLDGWREDNDRLRGVRGSFECFLETIERVAKIRDKFKNLVLGVNSVFLPQNEDKFYELYQKVKTLKSVDSHTFTLARGVKVGEEWKKVDIDKYRDFCQRVKQDTIEGIISRYSFPLAKFKVAESLLEKEIIYQVVKQRRRQIPCYAGKLNLVLRETGDVYPCEMLPWKFGNVREAGYDLGKILAGKEVKKYLARIKAGTQTCNSCTHECYLATNILFNIKELLKVKKAADSFSPLEFRKGCVNNATCYNS